MGALVHTPPAVASVSVVVKPLHTDKLPKIAVGCVFTVTTVVTAQVPIVYDIVDVPTFPPVTTPPLVIVATVVVTLLHVPPPVASVKFNENVWQIEVVLPEIATGSVFTVTTCVTKQVPSVYDIVDVPTRKPLTVPSVPTVAMVVAVLLHVPPPVASVSAVVDPWHTVGFPVITAGCVFTVTVVVT